MTSKASHTAIPWTLETHRINEPEYGHGVVFTKGGMHRNVFINGVGELEVSDADVPKLEANARYICRAVNSHDELVLALKGFLHADPDVFGVELAAARAAIARAEGDAG